MRNRQRIGKREVVVRRARAVVRVRALFVLVLIASLAAAALGQEAGGDPVVERMRIVGRESLTAREVARALDLTEGRPLDAAGLPTRVDSLVRLLVDAGRPFATVDVIWEEQGEGRASVDVLVDEGPLIRLNELVLRGQTVFDSEELDRMLELKRGAVVTERRVKRDIDALLEAYVNAGRPLASVGPGSAALSSDGALTLALNIAEGPAVRFADLAVTGNPVTKSAVIEREAGIEPGSLYDAMEVGRIRSRLLRTGYFEAVSDPAVSLDPRTGLATVAIDVSEGPSSRIVGVLGYAPRGDDDEITGTIDVALGNIAGSGRSAGARWERIAPGHTRAAFSYTEPWVLGSPVDIGVSGRQTVRDTIYTTTEGDLSIAARMGDRTRLSWSVGAERYVPGGADPTTVSYRTALGASFDAADDLWNPTGGLRLDGELEYAAKEEADGGGESRSGRLRADSRVFFGVRRGHVLAFRGLVEGIASTEVDVPYHEQLTLGGASMLRGYREQQFRGTRVALGSVEYRVIIGRRSRALVFIDTGYYYRGGSNLAKGTKLGYGIGLRGETRLGIIALDYGLGEGDGFLDGKLHVGLTRDF